LYFRTISKDVLEPNCANIPSPVVFNNQLLIAGRNFGIEGDSGSLVVDDKGDAVGLFHGLLHGSCVYVASPIMSIMDHFDITFVKSTNLGF
jgi:hypothetical protein